MDPLAPEPRRPRPVAGLPAVDARDVAKAWLVELVAGSALEEAGDLPVAEIVREGPGIADAVLAALGDDTALRRLTAGGNLDWLSSRAGALAGATGAAGAVRAAEALRRATLASVLAAGRLDAVTTAELSDRLAHVCALVAEASAGHVAEGAAPAAQEPEPAPAPRRAAKRGGSGGSGGEREGGSWESAVERRLERHAQDGNPFALLAIEVDGVERLRAAQEDGQVDELLEEVERALTGGLRPADQLLPGEPGRYWVTAPDTGPAVGRVLAELLAETARSAAEHGGAPLTVSVGVATCPEDGRDVDALAAAADQAMFAARASGAPVS